MSEINKPIIDLTKEPKYVFGSITQAQRQRFDTLCKIYCQNIMSDNDVGNKRLNLIQSNWIACYEESGKFKWENEENVCGVILGYLKSVSQSKFDSVLLRNRPDFADSFVCRLSSNINKICREYEIEQSKKQSTIPIDLSHPTFETASQSQCLSLQQSIPTNQMSNSSVINQSLLIEQYSTPIKHIPTYQESFITQSTLIDSAIEQSTPIKQQSTAIETTPIKQQSTLIQSAIEQTTPIKQQSTPTNGMSRSLDEQSTNDIPVCVICGIDSDISLVTCLCCDGIYHVACHDPSHDPFQDYNNAWSCDLCSDNLSIDNLRSRSKYHEYYGHLTYWYLKYHAKHSLITTSMSTPLMNALSNVIFRAASGQETLVTEEIRGTALAVLNNLTIDPVCCQILNQSNKMTLLASNQSNTQKMHSLDNNQSSNQTVHSLINIQSDDINQSIKLSDIRQPISIGKSSCFQPIQVDDIRSSCHKPLTNEGIDTSQHPLIIPDRPTKRILNDQSEYPNKKPKPGF